MRLPVRRALVLAALVLAPATAPAQVRVDPRDRSAIAAEIERLAETSRRAWAARDPNLLVPDSAFTVRTAQGATIGATQARVELQRRMNATVRVDTMVEVLDSVRATVGDTVLTYSSVKFALVMRLPSGAQRMRISHVINERPFVRVAGRWREAGWVRELAPRAWWADETPAGLAAIVDSLRTLDSAWARTYAANDTVLAVALLSDRLFMTTSDWRVKDKAAELGDIRPSPNVQMLYFRTTDVRVDVLSGAGIVVGIAEWAFTSGGQRSSIRRRYGAVYVRGGALGWQLTSLHMGAAL